MSQSHSAIASALAPDLGSVPLAIATLIRGIMYKCCNIHEISTLLTHAEQCMIRNDTSNNADLFCFFGETLLSDPQIVVKIPEEQRELYCTILKRIGFVASYLSRNLKNPISHDLVNIFYSKGNKRERSIITTFFYTGHETLARLCFFGLVTIVPERPWTDEDAALFLRTLEEINPKFSRLFTQVFDNLIDHNGLRELFSKDEEYSKHPQYFSDSVFKSLSKVVRPKCASFE
jgi:hypothetical protein